jgi:hypothetical protein
MSLRGPSKTVVVEPLEVPVTQPKTQPATPPKQPQPAAA